MPAPSSPQNVVLQSGNGKNLISWDIVSGATTYLVQRSTDGVVFTTLASTGSTNYIDSTCLVGVNYFYEVASSNSSGVSSYIASYPPSITPCLPGQINLGYLRYMSQLRADKLNSQYLTLDEWNWNINQSADELYDILMNNYGDNYFLAPPLIITLDGSSTYDLPNGSNYSVLGVPSPAVLKVSGVDVNANGPQTGSNQAWLPMSRFNWSDRDKYSLFPGMTGGAAQSVYQMSYRVMGNKLYVLPANSAMVIRLFYVPIRPPMLSDTDMLPYSFSGWSEYVINDAAQKAMIKEETFPKWTALEKAKANLVERIVTSASNRDVDQVNTVSNTRATYGDPGFGTDMGRSGFGF